MVRPCRYLSALLAFGACAGAVSTTRAETAAPTPAEIRPPTLLQVVEATLPRGTTLETDVVVALDVSIRADGTVESATATPAGNPELERAAEAAALTFLFEPARLGEAAVPVVIRYEYWFAATEPAEPDPAPAAPLPPPRALEAEPVTADPEPILEAVAEVEAPLREPTRRTLPRERLSKTPGARGDAIRAVELLPGVSRAPGGSNPILRGAAGHESTSFLDGVEIPQLYHFGGITSVVHPALLEEVNLYPSNFSARYGRATGGIIEAKLRSPRLDAVHGMIDLNLIDSSVMVEAPFGDDLGMAAAVRRSNIDLAFEAFVPDDAGFDVVAAPLYWDYLALAEYQPARHSRLRLFANGSRDELEFLFSEPNQEDPTLRGELSGSLEYHTVTLAYDQKREAFSQAYQVSVGQDRLKQRVGESTAYFDGLRVAGRAEWDAVLAEGLDGIVGLDFAGSFLTGAYRGSAAPSMEGSLDEGGATMGQIAIDDVAIHQLSPAMYSEFRWAPSDEWLWVPGIRLDYFEDLDALTVNPRLSQRYTFAPDWALKAGVGAYSQRPVYYESIAGVGNPDIQPYHALHTTLGVERRFGEALTVDVGGFYKYLYERVVATEGGREPHFENDGEGRIVGLETQASLNHGPYYGQLSYTLSHSERRDREEDWRLFDNDQTHVMNLAAGVDLGSGWDVGARFRFVSGNPTTPVVGAVFDGNSGVYRPRYGEHNSERDPAFHQLDLRVDKQFRIGSGSLGGYLELMNVYNQENAEGYGYSYDYSERTRVTSLPFFPNLGLKGEL